MICSQKDRLDDIQHTLLLTAEKNFIENERKMPIFDIFFWAATAYVTTNIKNRIFWQIKIFGKKIIWDNLGDFHIVISQQSNDTKTIALVQLYKEFWAFEVGSTRNSHN